jgi:hypothetical protein
MAQEFSYGGQEVIEGVMMRGSRLLAVAVRAPDGNIVLHEEPVNAALYLGPISKIPFVRGLTMLWDALGLGMRRLMFSANVAVGKVITLLPELRLLLLELHKKLGQSSLNRKDVSESPINLSTRTKEGKEDTTCLPVIGRC